MNKLIIVFMLAILTGCASVHRFDGSQYHTLGIAEVRDCIKYEGREDKVIERCIKVKTDAFSGWEAVMNGAATAVVKILTLGMIPI